MRRKAKAAAAKATAAAARTEASRLTAWATLVDTDMNVEELKDAIECAESGLGYRWSSCLRLKKAKQMLADFVVGIAPTTSRYEPMASR